MNFWFESKQAFTSNFVLGIYFTPISLNTVKENILKKLDMKCRIYKGIKIVGIIMYYYC